MTFQEAVAGREALAGYLPKADVTIENFLIDHPEAYSVRAEPQDPPKGGYTLEFWNAVYLGEVLLAFARAGWQG